MRYFMYTNWVLIPPRAEVQFRVPYWLLGSFFKYRDRGWMHKLAKLFGMRTYYRCAAVGTVRVTLPGLHAALADAKKSALDEVEELRSIARSYHQLAVNSSWPAEWLIIERLRRVNHEIQRGTDGSE